ncbi:hypothetical protein A3D78_04315 [Candidatus Gottesmanbacteria bacterium RIFCSPHIGHO2_02_FULL_39_14]|uniref:histidine kinase n=2 Tax=Candidatus Gottesmaniibacteriota TaxID=1752720 RepID=A0A1F5ZTM8_9BACT|nr:MAG: hypothetical protein A2153_00415 [Candidatus Gottesmanbacteria bacterium RBG_16_38_7b]OGG15819.1 MAG: hypothetical protein A3D78_04315 [Candidatus Gottesmanbacteria bacterium RIFCSPHIGHO2_02_FULL_39_14]
MNYKSIHFRLSFWYSLTFFIGLILTFTSFYLVTRQVLYNQTDTSLVNHGRKVVEVVSQKSSDMHQILAQRTFLSEFSEIPGMLVTILDEKGNIISSSMMCCYDQSIFNGFYQKAVSGKVSFIQNQIIAGENLRFFTSPVFSRDILLGVVLVGHPIGIIQNSLNTILIVLGFVAILLLIPTILGGFLLSKKALQPVTAISENLKFVSSENLNRKVESPKTADELEKLADSFNLLLTRLNKAFKREKEFIATVAHELKTPLSIIRGNTELTLAKTRSPLEYKKALQDSLIDINSMSQILTNILDLAVSEAGAFKSNLKVFDLSKTLHELTEIALNLAKAKHININTQIDEKVFISGHPDKLSRAILNILDNSIKYSPPKTVIGITLKRKRGLALIEINDHGSGISQKDLPHIFDRFYRGENVRYTPGSGLGLAISHAIITSHQGRLAIVSSPRHGTKVTISLPLSSRTLLTNALK